MTVGHITYVVCDNCGDGTGEAVTRTRVEALATARAWGWHHRPNGRDLCDDCWDHGVR